MISRAFAPRPGGWTRLARARDEAAEHGPDAPQVNSGAVLGMFAPSRMTMKAARLECLAPFAKKFFRADGFLMVLFAECFFSVATKWMGAAFFYVVQLSPPMSFAPVSRLLLFGHLVKDVQ